MEAQRALPRGALSDAEVAATKQLCEWAIQAPSSAGAYLSKVALFSREHGGFRMPPSLLGQLSLLPSEQELTAHVKFLKKSQPKAKGKAKGRGEPEL
mmetsp:Transcript_26081/g.58444  ORF Transcript_26081/g.58444 Transcript_26081/m.58444 type:complete len:97 (-) Transcript_26081:394-684(-)